jgi:hypothetical protein
VTRCGGMATDGEKRGGANDPRGVEGGGVVRDVVCCVEEGEERVTRQNADEDPE